MSGRCAERRLRVIGVGCRWAGDDGVGPAVVDALASEGLTGADGVHAGIDAHLARDVAELVDLLAPDRRLVIVDAARVEPAGRVLDVPLDALARPPAGALSAHGAGVAEAVGLARALHEGDGLDVRVIAVTVGHRLASGEGLSPVVAVAVQDVVERIRVLAAAGPALDGPGAGG
ncbi:MAG: hydrogenase maturation protease [Vicinamibacterales bacterium]